MNAANAVVMVLQMVPVTVLVTLKTVLESALAVLRKTVPAFVVAQLKTVQTGKMIQVPMNLLHQ
jgi:hypothetical protein